MTGACTDTSTTPGVPAWKHEFAQRRLSGLFCLDFARPSQTPAHKVAHTSDHLLAKLQATPHLIRPYLSPRDIEAIRVKMQTEKAHSPWTPGDLKQEQDFLSAAKARAQANLFEYSHGQGRAQFAERRRLELLCKARGKRMQSFPMDTLSKAFTPPTGRQPGKHWNAGLLCLLCLLFRTSSKQTDLAQPSGSQAGGSPVPSFLTVVPAFVLWRFRLPMRVLFRITLANTL